jgi:hypothetical protein
MATHRRFFLDVTGEPAQVENYFQQLLSFIQSQPEGPKISLFGGPPIIACAEPNVAASEDDDENPRIRTRSSKYDFTAVTTAANSRIVPPKHAD